MSCTRTTAPVCGAAIIRVAAEVDPDVVGRAAAEVEDQVAGLGLRARDARDGAVLAVGACAASEMPSWAKTYWVKPGAVEAARAWRRP